MAIITSTHFASVSASGENWRDISKKVLEELESIKTDGFVPNIGFLYMTDALAEDASSILTLFRSVTGIEQWTGCAALGICAHGTEYVDIPAISAMVGMVPPEKVRSFFAAAPNFKRLHQELEPWLNTHDSMLTIVHADPFAESQPARTIEEIDAMVGGFMIGGLASSRKEGAIVGREAMSRGVSGFVFDADIAVATALSQGCVPMGPLHDISRADDHVIGYMDGRTPFEVFGEDMTAMATQRLGFKPDDRGEGKILPEDLLRMIDGQIHIAFPVAGTDLKDFLVRNILVIDPESGVMAVAETIEDGQKAMFVYRNDETVRSDLAAMLVALRKRIMHERGAFSPKAALYVSCVARAAVSFSNDGKPGGEMALLKDVLGDIPTAGFYASGEISNNRLYGYTGILTLFL